jgi:hypothetical protein
MNLRRRRELCAARELIEIRVLAAALDALLTALRFEHPTLDTLAEPTDPPTLRAARGLVSQLRLLRAGLRSYRAALRDVLAHPPDDDIPF